MAAGADSAPNRSNRARWTLAIVGAVSPEPMIARTRGPLIVWLVAARAIRGREVVHRAGELVGVLGVDVVVAGEPADAGVRDRLAGRFDGAPLPPGPVRVAAVGRGEQDRDGDLRVAPAGVVLPETAQDGQVVLEGEPRGDRAVGPDLEVRERPADPALGPVAVGRPDVALDLLEPAPGQPRWREGGQAGVPVGELAARLEPAAVDTDDRPDRVGVTGGQLEDHVAAPGLSGRDRSLEPEALR